MTHINFNWKRILIGVGGLAILVAVICVAVILSITEKSAKGAVVSSGQQCASVGRSILEQDGSAVDAAIATLFCEGISMPQSMGLGGGFLMTIYDSQTGTVTSLNAREVAPSAAYPDMFGGDSSISQRGNLSIAVPMELRGYWYAYQRYGKLEWRKLVEPTIQICRDGVLITEYLRGIFDQSIVRLQNDAVLREIFIDPTTNEPYAVGEKYKMLRLAETLEIIAEEGGEAIHNGSLTEKLANDISQMGGIITAEDLRSATPQWQEPIVVNLTNNQTLYTAPLPGSGVILSFILNLLHEYLDFDNYNSITNWQRIVESFKFGYAKRTELGDLDFVPEITSLVNNLTSLDYANEIRQKIMDNATSQDAAYYGASASLIEDHGTAHVSVLAPNGDAVSVTIFGSGLVSESTGIILNDEMDDFSSPNISSNYNIPPSPNNYIQPGKRPLSSMTPTIIVDENQQVKLIIGGAGGTKITTSVALVIIRHLWFGIGLKEAINDKRLHHQLFPMYIEFESVFENDMSIVEGLSKIGHNYTLSATTGFSALTAITKLIDDVMALTIIDDLVKWHTSNLFYNT